MKSFAIALSLAIGLIRPVLLFVELNHHLQSSYEAIAHITVGALFAWYFANDRLWERTNGGQRPVNLSEYQWTLYAAIGLTAVEVICAIITVATR